MSVKHTQKKNEFTENTVYILAIKNYHFMKITKLYCNVYVQVYSVSIFYEDMKKVTLFREHLINIHTINIHTE